MPCHVLGLRTSERCHLHAVLRYTKPTRSLCDSDSLSVARLPCARLLLGLGLRQLLVRYYSLHKLLLSLTWVWLTNGLLEF
jgi:hypothetical protein